MKEAFLNLERAAKKDESANESKQNKVYASNKE
jgi:hypothetical protein